MVIERMFAHATGGKPSHQAATTASYRVRSAAAMADVEPLQALHYNLEKTGGLQDVVAPPYDVIGPEQRAELAARSPYNVVRIDLPEGDSDPYAHAAESSPTGAASGSSCRRAARALAAHPGLHGTGRAARDTPGFLARVRVTEYGAGPDPARTSARTLDRRRTG